MSKQKSNNDSPETEKEVTENLLVEQEETTKEETTIEKVDNSSIVVPETTPEIEKPVKSSIKPGNTISVKANKTGKMGVAKFLMLYPQDPYTETLLKFYYPKSLFTKDEWFQRIEDIKNTRV